MKFAKILLPTDYSTYSDYAAEVAQSLARSVGSTVELVHVYAVPVTLLPDGTPVPPAPSALLAAQERAEADMTEAKRRFETAAPNVPVEGRAVPGDTLEELMALAGSGRFDLIVMGTHGRSGVRRLLMGSLAEAVIRHSPIPVIAVRLPPPAQATEHAPDVEPAHT